MASNPIIFLDIDGVLNTTKHNTQIVLQPLFVQRLKHIIEITKARVVLTTCECDVRLMFDVSLLVCRSSSSHDVYVSDDSLETLS